MSYIVCLFIIVQDMMQCIAYATADQYHLPTLCHDLIAHGFVEINELPRGESTCITWHEKHTYLFKSGMICIEFIYGFQMLLTCWWWEQNMLQSQLIWAQYFFSGKKLDHVTWTWRFFLDNYFLVVWVLEKDLWCSGMLKRKLWVPCFSSSIYVIL